MGGREHGDKKKKWQKERVRSIFQSRFLSLPGFSDSYSLLHFLWLDLDSFTLYFSVKS
uniref:Uncharacterized protein n=1 Tax=Rhizophora mucronata TaxID=61149 RepID=A0A2P2IQR4_RHIMU